MFLSLLLFGGPAVCRAGRAKPKTDYGSSKYKSYKAFPSASEAYFFDPNGNPVARSRSGARRLKKKRGRRRGLKSTKRKRLKSRSRRRLKRARKPAPSHGKTKRQRGR